jgi:hypothetical protein
MPRPAIASVMRSSSIMIVAPARLITVAALSRFRGHCRRSQSAKAARSEGGGRRCRSPVAASTSPRRKSARTSGEGVTSSTPLAVHGAVPPIARAAMAAPTGAHSWAINARISSKH